MARVFASFCVCSLIVLNSFCQPVLAVSEVPLDFMRLCVIPEADVADRPIPNLQSIDQPPCQFLQRHLTAAPSCQANQGNETSTTSCPIESQYGTESRSPKIWNKAWAEFSQRSKNVNTWFVQSALRFSRQMKFSAREIVDRQNLRARDFVNEIQRLIPLRSENTYPVNLPGIDPEKEVSPTDHESDHYWQYYEDCDHWRVIFAMATSHSHFNAACLTSRNVTFTHKHPIIQLANGLAVRDLLKTIGATNQLITEVHNSIEYQYRLQEFREIESLGIEFANRKRAISRSLRAGWESHVQAVAGVVSQVRMEHFISLKRSYPANALRSGSSVANRYSSLR